MMRFFCPCKAPFYEQRIRPQTIKRFPFLHVLARQTRNTLQELYLDRQSTSTFKLESTISLSNTASHEDVVNSGVD
jgi:hypothetical protein